MAEETATAPPAKSGPGLIVIVIAVLVAAALAGGAVYMFAAPKSDAAAQGDKSDTKATEVKAPAVYVKLDPPFVANFEAKGAMRFLQVSVDVMTRDPATSEMVRQHDAIIRNDLLMLFGSQSYESLRTAEGKEVLRQAALEAVRKIVAAEGGTGAKVEQVYFTSFVMQ